MNLELRRIDHEACSVVAKKALLATCQIFKIKDNTKELPLGHSCGILLEFNSNHYLFTNAHVIDDIDKQRLFILLSDREKMTIAGQHYISSMPNSGNRKEDPFDIAVLKLHPDAIGRL